MALLTILQMQRFDECIACHVNHCSCNCTLKEQTRLDITYGVSGTHESPLLSTNAGPPALIRRIVLQLMVGRAVGRDVGRSVGRSDGRSVGLCVGRLVGRSEGRSVGLSVGRSVGRAVGRVVGDAVVVGIVLDCGQLHACGQLDRIAVPQAGLWQAAFLTRSTH